MDVDQQDVVVIGPPLPGQRYVSADSCCDASRHTRAAMPINGRVWLAQRSAVDWEQLDINQRIYSGPREKLTSYTIYGRAVLAVTDAKVVSVINDQPEQVPGQFPKDISLRSGRRQLRHPGSRQWALSHVCPHAAGKCPGAFRRARNPWPSPWARRQLGQLNRPASTLSGDGQTVLSRFQRPSVRDR